VVSTTLVLAGHIRCDYPRSMMLPSKVLLVVVSPGILSLPLLSEVRLVVVPENILSLSRYGHSIQGSHSSDWAGVVIRMSSDRLRCWQGCSALPSVLSENP
jgi:hypothetical protein